MRQWVWRVQRKSRTLFSCFSYEVHDAIPSRHFLHHMDLVIEDFFCLAQALLLLLCHRISSGCLWRERRCKAPSLRCSKANAFSSVHARPYAASVWSPKPSHTLRHGIREKRSFYALVSASYCRVKREGGRGGGGGFFVVFLLFSVFFVLFLLLFYTLGVQVYVFWCGWWG